jgi:uncharacterized protein YecE (DUF72 family)
VGRHAPPPQPEVIPQVRTCWDLFRACLAGFEAHGKLGYVLFQFPRWTGFSQGVLRYLEEVRNRLTDQPVAVEWRHRSWWEGPARERMASALRELRMACVVADCPPVEWAPPPEAEVRFLVGDPPARPERGRVAAGSRGRRRLRLPVLRGGAAGVGRESPQPRRRVERLFVMFNNCTRGQAAVNAARMVSLFPQQGSFQAAEPRGPCLLPYSSNTGASSSSKPASSGSSATRSGSRTLGLPGPVHLHGAGIGVDEHADDGTVPEVNSASSRGALARSARRNGPRRPRPGRSFRTPPALQDPAAPTAPAGSTRRRETKASRPGGGIPWRSRRRHPPGCVGSTPQAA